MALSTEASYAISWTLFSIAIVLTAVRYYARSRYIQSFFWDDLAHGFAVVFAAVELSVFTAALQLAPAVVAYDEGESSMPPDYARFQRLLIAWVSFHYAVLWSVRAAFLLLYRMLFGVSKSFKRWWWAVTIFTFVAFWATVSSAFVYCGPLISDTTNEAVCDSDYADSLQYKYLIYATALNISNDLMIIILALAMIHKLPMAPIQRFGLVVIFGLVALIIAVDIVRVLKSITSVTSENLNFVLSSLESSVAIWVSCVPSLSILAHQSRHIETYEHDASRPTATPTSQLKHDMSGRSAASESMKKPVNFS